MSWLILSEKFIKLNIRCIRKQRSIAPKIPKSRLKFITKNSKEFNKKYISRRVCVCVINKGTYTLQALIT